jgi:hypothetical protein
VVQNRVIKPTLAGAVSAKPPLAFRLLAQFPFLQRIPARLIGIGIRPEHIATPDVAVGRRPTASYDRGQ